MKAGTRPKQARSIKCPCWALSSMLVCWLWPLAATSQAQVTTVTGVGVNDVNTATLDPYPAIPVYQCDWIDQGLADAGFTAANGWNISYSGAAEASFLKKDLKIIDNTPWVVNQPNVVAPGGTTIPGSISGQDAGGADFGLEYTPRAGTSDPTNVFFIQAEDDVINGAPDVVILDNGGGSTPFYDGPTGTSGSSSWMIATPSSAADGSDDYSSSIQFQTFVAVDNVVDGVNNVTLYGGDWWGYDYSATAIPEPAPSALTFGLAAMAGVVALRRRKRSMAGSS